MVFKNHVALFILVVFTTACGDQQTEPKNELETRTQNGDHLLISSIGDTILTRMPIPVKDVMVKPHAATPQYKRLTSPPRVKPTISSVQPGRKPKSVLISSQIGITTPGQDGIPMPRKVLAEGKETWNKHPQAVPALAPAIRYEATSSIQYLDIDQGMNSSSVNAIIEDDRGHLWFGTNGGGVSRYDGTSFTHYRKETGLSSDAIACILEDSQGNLWLGTKGGGVNRYDGEALFHYGKEAGLNDTYVESMVEDRAGNIWFGMRRGGGLIQYDGNNFIHFTEREGLISNEVRCLFSDSEGHLWIGTGKGASKFDGTSFYQYTTADGLSSNRVESIFEDRSGKIWFGTIAGGLCAYDGVSFTHYGMEEGLASNDVLTIVGDVHGDLWLGTRGGGVSHYHDEQFTRYGMEDGLSSNHVTSIKQDSRGILWFGTWGGGVSKLNTNSFTFMGREDGLDGDDVLSVMEDDQGNLWIGTQNGVSRYDGKSFTRYGPEEGLGRHPILSTLPVISILEDSQGNLWFGTDLAGVNRFDGEGFTHYGKEEGLSHAAIMCMLEDSNGYIWFGTRDGLTLYDPGSNSREGSFTHFFTGEGLWVGSMLEDKMGNIWMGTTNGAISYDGSSFTSYTKREGLPRNGVSSIMEDNQGNIWIGSDNGVSRYDGREFKNYKMDDGLPHNNVRSIVEDNDNNIWLSTERGIAAMVPVAKESVTTGGLESNNYRFFTFGKGDGLKRLDFASNSACLDGKNQIWWGGSGGLTMLELNTFVFAKDSSQISLASIEISQTHIDFRKIGDEEYRSSISFGNLLEGTFDSVVPFCNYPNSLSMPHEIDHLTFHLSTGDLIAPHQTKYSFFLEGADRSWSHPSNANAADYRNLTPGFYTFRAKAIGAAKIWSAPIAYSFTIYPPWWKTPWAYAMYGVLFIYVLWSIRRYEKNRESLRHQLALENIRANKLEEINAIKTRFFANISHEFRTPLTLMLGPVKELIESYPKSNLSYLQLIQNGSHRLLNLINQLLALTKFDASREQLQASYQDFIPFIRRIFGLFISMTDARNIQYTYHSTTETQFGFFNSESFERILVNLLDNAIKFTPDGGAVSLDVENKEKVLMLTISDTGPGIPSTQVPHIFDRFFQIGEADSNAREGTGIGLALVRELVRLHHGSISVESEVGHGSRFIIQMPLGQAHLKEDEIVESKLTKVPVDITVLGSITQSSPVIQFAEPANEELPLVLVVEDNADMRTYIRHCLGGKFRIAEATNGEQAIVFARKNIPDFILSDVMMPGMSGLALCQKLKNDRLTSHIPIVLLTAKADREHLIEGLRRGADAYLSKPFDKQELLIRIQKLIELRKLLQEHYQNRVHLESTEDVEQKIENDFIRQLCQHVEDNLNNHQFDIPQLCRSMQMSRAQLYRKVKALTGSSVGHFIRRIRLRKAFLLLKSSQLNISEIAYEVGFQDPAYFSRTFSEEYGMSPKKVR